MSKILANEKFCTSKVMSNISIQMSDKNRTKLSKFRLGVENFVQQNLSDKVYESKLYLSWYMFYPQLKFYPPSLVYLSSIFKIFSTPPPKKKHTHTSANFRKVLPKLKFGGVQTMKYYRWPITSLCMKTWCTLIRQQYGLNGIISTVQQHSVGEGNPNFEKFKKGEWPEKNSLGGGKQKGGKDF